MPSLTPIHVNDAKTLISNWNAIRGDSTKVNAVFKADHHFSIDVSNLPPSLKPDNLTCHEKYIHGYLGIESTDNLSPVKLKLVLISLKDDDELCKNSGHQASVFTVDYELMIEQVKKPEDSTINPWYEMMMRWNTGYTGWVEEMNALSPTGEPSDNMTQAFKIPMSDIQPSYGETTQMRYAFLGLWNDSRPLANKVDLLFYDTNLEGLIDKLPGDFTTPVPPFPNGRKGWALLANNAECS